MRLRTQIRYAVEAALVLVVIGLGLGTVAGSVACAPGSKPDKFMDAVVDCAKINPQASAAFSAVQTCLVGALSQNYVACLAGLVTEAHFAVDEIVCIVSYYSQEANTRVATKVATDTDYVVRKAANDFLRDKRISIQNTYPGMNEASGGGK